MSSKFRMKVGVVATICSFGVANSQVASARQIAVAIKSSCCSNGITMSISSGWKPLTAREYEASSRRQAIQVASGIGEYNSNFAANYTRWLAKNGTYDVRVATANNRIQCFTSGSPAMYLCQPGEQSPWIAMRLQHRQQLSLGIGDISEVELSSARH